jgi:transcriptional/translational regulatory protein YebC/TACO1
MLSAELSMIPTNTVSVDGEMGRRLLKLMDALDENDDVQKAHANFALPDELLAELG